VFDHLLAQTGERVDPARLQGGCRFQVQGGLGDVLFLYQDGREGFGPGGEPRRAEGVNGCGPVQVPECIFGNGLDPGIVAPAEGFGQVSHRLPTAVGGSPRQLPGR
jgi:hypothetical protein